MISSSRYLTNKTIITTRRLFSSSSYNNNARRNSSITSSSIGRFFADNFTDSSSSSCNNFRAPIRHGNGWVQRSALSTSVSATSTYDQSIGDNKFPSIIIGSNRTIIPQGTFAKVQAEFLQPDEDIVKEIAESLLQANMGVVAHYYMDVELQGILEAVKSYSPQLQNRIGVADSLKMGDLAVSMIQNDGVTSIACLGVDFMSESVSAIIHKNGYTDIPVYRATSQHIGCSLAESAESKTYKAWLQKEGVRDANNSNNNNNALHVIYINTSLETKATSSSTVPTITCTSSNVLQTMLQASVQIPDIKILYGPDTYMGNNLVTLFDTILANGDEWTNERIQKELHPDHTIETIRKLRDSINVYPSGNCVVHHMFGSEVVKTVKEHYDDAYVTAHLEVPGEMFEIAMNKSLEGKGVVGSTSNILNFISNKVKEEVSCKHSTATSGNTPKRLRFVLGTEAGMITSIVKSIQDILEDEASSGNSNKSLVEAEIIFPVASDAIMSVNDDETPELSIVPGVSGGEGCSTAGGCATCPFMKMNDIDALQNVINMVIDSGSSDSNELTLKAHLPPNRLVGRKIDGIDAMELGTESIVHMREFMKNNTLSDNLVSKVLNN